MDVSAVDFDGWTPLHAAAHWGQADACRILAEKLCNMEARSNAVRTRTQRSQWPFDCVDCIAAATRDAKTFPCWASRRPHCNSSFCAGSDAV